MFILKFSIQLEIRSSWFGSSTLSSPQLGSTLSLNNNKQQQKLTAIKGGLKEPRPQRTVIVAAAISQGIREAIATTEGDIDTLKNSLSHLTIQSQQVGISVVALC